MIRILTIMDNHSSEQKSLIAEHGLSFLIETDSGRLLFDYGAGEHAYENAEKLNVPVPDVDYAVCSHGHYDHAGGYPFFAENGLKAPFVTGEGFFREKYAYDGEKATYLGTGFSENFLHQKGVRHVICHNELQLVKGCYAVGKFDRTYEFETIPERFVLLKNGTWVQDEFEDEICLVLEYGEELIVVVGCSHPGILNMLSSIQKRFQKPIHAVLGGTHLVEANEERIKKTLDEMKKLGVKKLGFNHCSGELLQKIMEKDYALQHFYIGAGDCIVFP